MGFGDCFINLFILADPTKEIPLGYFRTGILVVGIARRDLQGHVCSDDGWVVTDGLEENQRKPPLPRDARFDVGSELHHAEPAIVSSITMRSASPASTCAIGRIYKRDQRPNLVMDGDATNHGCRHCHHPSTIE